MDAVGDRMFFANNPFEAVRGRSDLNALQKLRETVRQNQADKDRTSMTLQAIPITQNPRLLVEMIKSNREILTPYYRELLEEGTGTAPCTRNMGKSLRSCCRLLTSLWLLPSLFPTSREGMRRKFHFIGDLLEKMDVPLMDSFPVCPGR